MNAPVRTIKGRPAHPLRVQAETFAARIAERLRAGEPYTLTPADLPDVESIVNVAAGKYRHDEKLRQEAFPALLVLARRRHIASAGELGRMLRPALAADAAKANSLGKARLDRMEAFRWVEFRPGEGWFATLLGLEDAAREEARRAALLSGEALA